MKNKHLYIIAIVGVMITSCKKETSDLTLGKKTSLKVSDNFFSAKPYTGGIVDLTLKPGYTDTYVAPWGVGTLRFSNLTWDLSLTSSGDPYYATVENDDPANSPQYTIAVVGNHFAITVWEAEYLLAYNNAFYQGVNDYSSAWDTWANNGHIGAPPELSGYIISAIENAGGAGKYVTLSGKLIRNAAGDFAVADEKYQP
jgi:hypothetical protein